MSDGDLYERAAKAGYSGAAVHAATQIEWTLDKMEAVHRRADALARMNFEEAATLRVYEIGGLSDVIMGFCGVLAEIGDTGAINGIIKAVRKHYGYRRTIGYEQIRAAARDAIRDRMQAANAARGRGGRESLRNDFN